MKSLKNQILMISEAYFIFSHTNYISRKAERVLTMNANRFYACLFFSLILLVGTSYGDVNNILLNPGFENPTDGSPWTARGGTFATTTSQKHSGTRSGRARSRTATWQGIQQDVLSKMVVGQTYTVSAWLRTGDTNNSYVQLTFEEHDDSGTNYIYVASGTANNTGWTYLSGSYTLSVSGTLTYLSFYAEGPNSGTDLYLDDANVFGQVPGPPPPIDTDANGVVNFATVYQEIEGFGAAAAWYEGWLEAIPEPNRTNIYNTLFSDSGLDILRIRNTYDYDSAYMSNIGTIVDKALVRNPNLKILCSSWSPPTYLKSTGALDSGTLIGGPSNYNYSGFATWWADSITAWSSTYGVNIDYASIQNEPDWNGNDRCLFNPTQDSTYAGYNQAFEAVWQEFNSRWGATMPKMIGPEAISWNGTKAYIDALIDVNHAYGFANHYYGCGTYESPDSFLAGMIDFGTNYGYKPLFQTEYEKLSGPKGDFTYAMDMAIIMHNGLVSEGLSSYIHWTLFWADDTNSLVSLPSWGSRSYTINPNYYVFKHYAKFTDPGWHRVAATEDSCDLRISAYKSPDDSNMAIVILNTTDICDINLTLSLGSTSPTSSEIYRTTSDANWLYVGTFNPAVPLRLPKKSITTIHLTGPVNFADCAAVLAGGYGIESDLTGDCYVDLLDLEIIANYWLNNNCATSGNCQDADFAPVDGKVNFIDLARFGPQWRWCNNPQDSSCTPNW
jgi:glucuronoarabinoxylan endo-1,4-beta-xylanase